MPITRHEHWDRVFTTTADKAVSWYQATPDIALRLIQACDLLKEAVLLDVGAGASRLPDARLAEGYSNIIVLDVSAVALDRTWTRLGDKGQSVRFILANIAAWQPDFTVDLWHDRAVLHFLPEERDRAAYAEALRKVVKPGGFVVISGFAPSGPERCSGLPVVRAEPSAISTLLGPGFDLLDALEEDHQPPSGGRQRFVFTRLRRQDAHTLESAHPILKRRRMVKAALAESTAH